MTENDLDRPITFNAAAAKFLPEDYRPSYATWWRWSQHGIRGIRLATLMCGGRRCTTPRAVEEFIAKVTAAANDQPLPARTPARRDAPSRKLSERWESSRRPRRARRLNNAKNAKQLL